MRKLLLICVALSLLVGCRLGDVLPAKSERMIVTFDWEADMSGIIKELTEQNIRVIEELDLIGGVLCYLTTEQQILLAAILPVRYMEPDYQVSIVDQPKAMAIQSEVIPLAAETIDWGLKRIAAPECWDIVTGRNVRVGVIDTGIASNHPDLKGAVKGGFNAIKGGSYEDDNNHGTFVASVIGARKNGVGIIGVAPNVDLYAIKVLDKKGRGYISDIIKGYQWGLKQEVDIVNLSLGSYYQSTAMKEAMVRAGFQGMGTIAAAGNDGRQGLIYPARNEIAVCVGAVGTNGKRMSWSNYGPSLKANGVVAPGDWVLAANKKGGWQRVSGTSIATPYVTGVLALMIERGYATRKLLFKGSSAGNFPDIYSGHGLINARKALQAIEDSYDENKTR